jgi:hypothetical protein
MKTSIALYQDEAGSIYSMELVLTTLIVVFGVIAGFASYRDAIAQELGDTAVALENIDQSYSYVLRDGAGVVIATRTFADSTTLVDLSGEAPAGLVLTTAATGE